MESNLKFIFVDAENIGLQQVSRVKASLTDRVFVFTKNDSILQLCEQKLFQSFSCYPTGTNQADFHIIGNLVGVLASLDEEQKRQCQFTLYSKDNSLVMAFQFQCHLHKAHCLIPLPDKHQTQLVQEISLTAIHQKILQQLQHPKSSEDVRKKLNLPKPDFTRAINELIKSKDIKRVKEDKKKWVKVS